MKPYDVIFLSASLPYREPWVSEVQPTEVEQVIVSLARAVFARGGRLLFGGHPSISPLIADIAGEYYPIDPWREVRPIVTVQSKFFEDKLPQKTWDLYTTGWSEIAWTPTGTNRENSLEIMRNAMLGIGDLGWEIAKRNKLSRPTAMFAIGGMEGIRDEAAIFLQAIEHSAVFALKTPGAAAARLLESPGQWRERLWPADAFSLDRYQALILGKKQLRLIDLEQQWADELVRRETELPKFELQPYGTMIQCALDEVLDGRQ